MTRPRVVIVGAGLAGLSCAHQLAHERVPFEILEATDEVGGRVRTDRLDGFLLDRGFQVLLTAYPEARRQLDYSQLELGKFYPGACVRTRSGFELVGDPRKRPADLIKTLFSKVGSARDKALVARLLHQTRTSPAEGLFRDPGTTSHRYLSQLGFSRSMIDAFFRPFLGGVFLDPELETASAKLRFVFRMFSEGDTAIPRLGMGEIPKQLARRLPEKAINLESRVTSLDRGSVTLEDGSECAADAIVLAADSAGAAALIPQLRPFEWRSVVCLYFGAPSPPIRGPVLVLDGTGTGPVNNLTVVSEVSSSVAPPGQALVSVSVLTPPPREEDERLRTSVLAQLEEWFGPEVRSWHHLRSYRIEHALPVESLDAIAARTEPSLPPGVFLCGDYLEHGSIQGAMVSGRKAATDLVRHLA